jgi:neutral ceramidase
LKKNPTRTALRALARALASAVFLLGILSFPWRAERPAAAPSVALARAGAGPLLAGVAVRPVELGSAPTIAGFARLRWSAEGVLHPITARALVVAEPGCSVALTSVELLLIPEELSLAVKSRVADLGLDAVVVAASHTHAGPGGYWDSLPGSLGGTGPYDPGAVERLVEALAGAIREAHAARAPASLALARGRDVTLAQSRDDAEVDGRLLALRLTRPSGAPLAELLAFAAHPTVLGMANRRISGDWPGALLRAAPRGPRLFFQGAVGDQSVRWPDAPNEARLEAYAASIGAALEALPAGPTEPSPRLAVAVAAVTLPRISVAGVPALLRPAVTTVAGGTFPVQAQVTALRLGGALLLFTPSEPVEAVGRAWRAAAGPDAEVLSLSDGYIGYVDTAAQVEAGRGEAPRTYYGPGLGVRLESAVAAAARAADAATPLIGGPR